MAFVITAPEKFEKGRPGLPKRSIFLAGAIDMGAVVDWQSYVIDAFKDCLLTVVNPRRAKFDDSTLDEQIKWELQALEDVDHIFMWFPKDAKAPISFFEAGLYWRSNKMIVGAELGFYRRRNLELTAWHYGIYLYPSLDDMIRMFNLNF